MFRKIFATLLMLATLFVAACGEQTETKVNKNLVVYSQLDQAFTDELLKAYGQSTKNISLSAVYELKQDSAIPDIILANSTVLQNLHLEGKFQGIISSAGDRIPRNFKDIDGYWYGVFYDPAVFLVNQQFARTVGQEKLLSWSDLARLTDAHISVENLTNSYSTIAFMSSFASKMGEEVFLNYMRSINNFINQYAKFPFTPVRMAAVGDADIAITRQSYVSKYLENNFPAYVIIPEEGTPANLFGIAVYKECKYKKEATDFINWIIADEAVKTLSQKIDTGYMFLLPNGMNGALANTENLWLNTKYQTAEQQEALALRWLQTVRFSDKNQEEHNEIRNGKPWLS